MDVGSLVHLLIWLIVIGLIFAVLWWGIAQIGLPEPFAKIAKAIIVIVAVLILVNFLLGLSGGAPVIRWR